MTMEIKTEQTNTIIHTAYLDRKEVERILAEAVAFEVGVGRDAPEVKVEVRTQEATEGSPGYRVGFSAHVIITRDLTILREAESRR